MKHKLHNLHEYIIIRRISCKELPDIDDGDVVVMLYTNYDFNKLRKKYASLKIIGMNENACLTVNGDCLSVCENIIFVNVKIEFNPDTSIKFTHNNYVKVKNCQLIGKSKGFVFDLFDKFTGKTKDNIYFDGCVKKINMGYNLLKSVNVMIKETHKYDTSTIDYDHKNLDERVVYDDEYNTKIMYNTLSNSKITVNRKNKTGNNFLETDTDIENYHDELL